MIDRLIHVYSELFVEKRQCICGEGTTDPLDVLYQDRHVICPQHGWLIYAKIESDDLTNAGISLPAPHKSQLGNLLSRDTGEKLASYFKSEGITPNTLNRNPLYTKPYITSIDAGEDSGKVAAYMSARLAVNRGSQEIHEGEHIVVYTSLSQLVSQRMQHGDGFVNEILIRSPLLIVHAGYDGRRGARDLLSVLYSRQYGFCLVTGEVL